ncbi:MAG TPA: recombinase family protein [Streptosporangiaceae bacterium]|nr:recombinase family protein [Streptosporangiaceae bacterium]
MSTDAQDYAKQLADLDAWDVAHGYAPSGAYTANGKSAFHGRQIPELDRAVADLEAGEYEVLTFWAADRMWRGESLAKALAYVERIHAAGGSVEFVKDPHLNVAEGVPAYVRNMLMAQAFGAAHGESERKSQRTRMDIAHKQATGAAHGRAPWGYRIEGAKDAKRFMPTDLGRDYAPQIFARIIEGQTLRQVAQWLTSEGVPTSTGSRLWNEGFIGNRLIKNPVYYGSRRNGGNLETEGLVSFQTWQAANAALAGRARPGRSATVNAKPLVQAVCWACYGVEREGCANGVSVMYRVWVGKGEARRAYYRCSGSGPQRRGCGAPMIPCEALDARVVEHFARSAQPHMSRVFVPGRNVAEEIRDLNRQISEAAAAGDYATVAALGAEATALQDADDTRPHWDTAPSGQTMGAHFASLDADGQRAYIAEGRRVLAARVDVALVVGEHFEGGEPYRWAEEGEVVETAGTQEAIRRA